ncbi:hypothetical protein [Synechococcus sp. PCC 7336]|uniref:hypothetical protein n=1 Tax=Synechococcus sp. PCC 7336 TaxID=195250 RepID=UPI000347E485|nr:hypothetical protein [Synechococcus sp. PCC 7336]
MSSTATCPICHVHISGDKVQFAYGGEGTKARLWARVCRHAKQAGCINDYRQSNRLFDEQDNFGQVETNEAEVMDLLKDLWPSES